MWGTIGTIVGNALLNKGSATQATQFDPIQQMASIKSAINFSDLMMVTEKPQEAGQVGQVAQSNVDAFDSFLNQTLSEMIRGLRA
jgi:ascorbate-specific PTS system EIIC-type component UlaA